MILIAAVLTLAAVICPVSAEEQPRQEILMEQTRKSYEDSKRSAGRDSFAGLCGVLTSHQLYNMGINTTVIGGDGKNQFDLYKNKTRTSGGYTVHPYYAREFTLEQALCAVSDFGKKEVHNILVGFEETKTENGYSKGHSCVINAIYLGKVYFVESYRTAYGNAGEAVACTISEFAQFFSDWTAYEGLIYFGNLGYCDTCTTHGTDLYVRTRFELELRSQPCLVGKKSCRALRTVSAGELLHATAVMQTPDGALFYRVSSCGMQGYLPADAAYPVRINPEEITAKLTVPETLKAGEKGAVTGTVQADHGLINTVTLTVTDENGEQRICLCKSVEKQVVTVDKLFAEADFGSLPKGSYMLSVSAQSASAVVRESRLVFDTADITLTECTLRIGTPQDAGQAEETAQSAPPDGWSLQNGVWGCRKKGRACTGWQTWLGLRYYLKKDGTVTAGKAEIDGKTYYFTDTGALCLHPVQTPEGTLTPDAAGKIPPASKN